ncbi:MAG: carbohydrate-binding domain-containing protein [Paludibacteraceae bacterium]|nr:carbohydrate-binding domain-containing protein [Paludibacteraceae bacterium]
MKQKNLLHSLICVLTISILGLFACETTEPSLGNENTTINNDLSGVDNDDDLVENSTFSTIVEIEYNSSSVEITNPLSDNGVTVSVSGTDVIVNSTTKEVEYIISGQASGSLKLYSDYKTKVTLNGVLLTNCVGPAINIQCKKTSFVVIEGDNTLTDASGYATENNNEDQKACFFSEGQLVFSGNGNLTINGNSHHALASDDYIRIISGSVMIMGNSGDAIHTNDAFIMSGGSVAIRSQDEGVACDEGYIYINGGSISITTTGTSAKGIKAAGQIIINDGIVNVSTSASESEGIESKGDMTINGGTIEVTAYDDCINVGNNTSSLSINGGYIYCKSTTNDGIDSNGSIAITGGVIVSIGAKTPEEGFDCDQNTFSITGGCFVGLGGSTSNPTESSCTQYNVIFNGSQNTTLNLSSSDGTQVLNLNIPSIGYTPTILFSSSELSESTTYIIKIGGTISGGTEWHGLYLNATYSGGIGTSTTQASLGGNSNINTPGGEIPGGNPGGMW